METKMTIMGVGPKIGHIAFPYLFATIGLHYWLYPTFVLPGFSEQTWLRIGLVLIALGLPLLGISAVQMLRAFGSGELATTGMYAVFRNPMYAAMNLIVIPGVCLLFGSWLVLTAPIFMYFMVQKHIKGEYDYLSAKFGKQYTDYTQRVWCKFY